MPSEKTKETLPGKMKKKESPEIKKNTPTRSFHRYIEDGGGFQMNDVGEIALSHNSQVEASENLDFCSCLAIFSVFFRMLGDWSFEPNEITTHQEKIRPVTRAACRAPVNANERELRKAGDDEARLNSPAALRLHPPGSWGGETQ